MPEPGQEETVRIVALDRSFHIGCYKCEVRGPGQGVKGILEVWDVRYGTTQGSGPDGKLLLLSNRSVGCCSPLRVSVRAATHWMDTSCARPAVPGASRSSQPRSPLTAEFSQKHLLHSPLSSTTFSDIHLYDFVTKCCFLFLQSCNNNLPRVYLTLKSVVSSDSHSNPTQKQLL